MFGSTFEVKPFGDVYYVEWLEKQTGCLTRLDQLNLRKRIKNLQAAGLDVADEQLVLTELIRREKSVTNE